VSNRVDLVGQKFGRLTVIADSGDRRYGNVLWDCLCECGSSHRVMTSLLTRGTVKSCGCLKRDDSNARFIDLTGKRYGRLVVLRHLEHHRCECRCDCGKVSSVAAGALRSGHTISCGCAKSESTRRRMTTHGLSGTTQHQMWKSARVRAKRAALPCTITVHDIHIPEVCPALGIPLVPGANTQDASPSLDRLRPDLGYVPGNVVVISYLANKIKQNCTSQQVKSVGLWMKSNGL